MFSCVGIAGEDIPGQLQTQQYFDVIYHPLLVEHVYSASSTTSLSSTPSSTGAIGVNIDYENGNATEYYIEQQRAGADWIAAGIANGGNQEYIDQGKLILQWGFDRMANDGSFPGTGDAVHSTSLFLEAAARATILLDQYANDQVVSAWAPKLILMANYVATLSTVGSPGRSNNLEPFNHRYFLRAAGIHAATIPNDSGTYSSLENAAKHLIEEGLDLQTDQGIMPEKGGFDFNYQSIGLTYVGRYAQLLGNSTEADQSLKSQIDQAMQISLDLFSDRVDSLGNVDLTDSTRINESSRSGRPKTLDIKNIVQGYLSASVITGDSQYLTLAELIVSPIRPVVEYIFEGPETLDGQRSSGSDTTADLFARTATNEKNENPLGGSGSGLTGNHDDYALDMTSVSSMGSGIGPFARTDGPVDTLDALQSFTMTGWYKTDVASTDPQVLGENIELFKTNKVKLTAVNNGHLRLFVDSHSSADSIVSTNADWSLAGEWGFFAVTYDGTQTNDNVNFYSGSIQDSQIKLSSKQTLDKGVVDSLSSRLYINRQNRPMDGYLDNMRFYGSKIDNSGVLSLDQLQDLHRFDTWTL